MHHSLSDLANSLSKISRDKFNNPHTEFDWPVSISNQEWIFSEQLLSLKNTELFEKMNEQQKKQLAFWECINFFSLNIHGEKSLLKGLTDQLYQRWPGEISDYLHHFVDEENKHMRVFGHFCNSYGGKIYPSKLVSWPRDYEEGEEDFLFFARVIIFEHLVDYFNVFMARDSSLHPFVRRIHQYHHNDEGRHLAFGRNITAFIFEQYKNRWSSEKLDSIRSYLMSYIESCWREYYNPSVFVDAGIKGDSYELYEMAWNNPTAKELRQRASRACIKFLLEQNILEKEPEL